MCHFLFIKTAFNAFFLSCSIQDLINGYWFIRLLLYDEIKLLPIGHHFSETVVFLQPQCCFLVRLSGAWNVNHHLLYLQLIYTSKDFMLQSGRLYVQQWKYRPNFTSTLSSGNGCHYSGGLSCFSVFEPFLEWQTQSFHFFSLSLRSIYPRLLFLRHSTWVLNCGLPVFLQHFWIGPAPQDLPFRNFNGHTHTMNSSLL